MNKEKCIEIRNLDSLIKVFFRWLKNNNIYHSYLNNMRDIEYVNNIESYKEYFDINSFNLVGRDGRIKKHVAGSIIDYSFHWCNTDEGDDFWRDKNNKWSDFFNSSLSFIEC